ncbi:MAG: aminotransferase class V-fold PLP-dependent enzyme [Phycisphaerales bacterium]
MSPFARHWRLDPAVNFLNHGSFGACPTRVLEAQCQLREEMEREPVRFMVERLEPLLDEARAALAPFVNARPEDLAFVPNATAAVNAFVRSLTFNAGDELLTISHAYNACVNVLREASSRTGAKLVIAQVPRFPRTEDEILDALLEHATPRTRLVLLCHITSPTALILPVERAIRALRQRCPSALILIDGAHAPGMIDVDLTTLDADAYTANCHKWICAPKGAAFLHVPQRHQSTLRPHIISHGLNSPRTDRSRYLLEFDWTGTADYTPYLCIPHALRAMPDIWRTETPADTHLSDRQAWQAIQGRNQNLARDARRLIAAALNAPLPTPDQMIGAIAAIPLPPGKGPLPVWTPNTYPDPLQNRLVRGHRIQVPVSHFPAWPERSVRISAQLHNHQAQYQELADALRNEGEIHP